MELYLLIAFKKYGAMTPIEIVNRTVFKDTKELSYVLRKLKEKNKIYSFSQDNKMYYNIVDKEI